MKTNTIIENIRYAYNLDTFSTAFSPERVYSAIENFDYFFKPGQDVNAFMKEYKTAFQEGTAMTERMKKACSMVDFPFSYEHTQWVMTAFSLVRLVKEFLDEDFFESNKRNIVNFRREEEKVFFAYLKRDKTQYDIYMDVRNYPTRTLLNRVI